LAAANFFKSSCLLLFARAAPFYKTFSKAQVAHFEAVKPV
jgi:hypothetical protein